MIFRNTFISIKEAIKNLWRNSLMSIASIASMMATLVILGLIFAIIININSFVEGAQEQFEEITVYLKDNMTSTETEKLVEEIKGIIGVKQVVYISKDEAMKTWKIEWGDNAYLLDGLNENPLPNSIVVTLKDLTKSESVVAILDTFEGIEDVKFFKDLIDKILGTSEFIRNLGFGLIIILLAISTFIIANTIKLAVNARRREINIMKYVGATNWFIKRPFLIEGTILGLVGALIASGIIYLAYSYIYNYFTSAYYVLIAAHFVPTQAVMNDLIVIFVVLGMGIGALGSVNAMRKHLNV